MSRLQRGFRLNGRVLIVSGELRRSRVIKRTWAEYNGIPEH